MKTKQLSNKQRVSLLFALITQAKELHFNKDLVRHYEEQLSNVIQAIQEDKQDRVNLMKVIN